jgi:hypothetical protein
VDPGGRNIRGRWRKPQIDPVIHTFVMIEFKGEKFAPKGWVAGETAARYAAELANRASGRPPDFRGTTGQSLR